MRKFGSKSETFRFQVEGSDKTYEVPLGTSLPVGDLIAMEDGTLRSQVEVLRKYAGEDVDGFSAGLVRDILNAWAEESTENGASPGE